MRRRRPHPAGEVTSTTWRTPDAPSRRSVSMAPGSCWETSATVGMVGNSLTSTPSTSICSGPQRCTDTRIASTARSRTTRMASGIESRCTTAKQPFPAASTRWRSPGSSTAATVVEASAMSNGTCSSLVVQEDRPGASTCVQPETRSKSAGDVPRAPDRYSCIPLSGAGTPMTELTPDAFSALQAALGPQYRLERELGAGWHGCRLPGDRYGPRPHGSHQGRTSGARRSSLHHSTLPRRGAHHRAAPASQRRRRPRRRHRGRPALLRDGRDRRREPAAAPDARGTTGSRRGHPHHRRPRHRRSTRPRAQAWCTAT